MNNIIYLKLIIKDYDLFNPLGNKEIQIANIDSKTVYEIKTTTINGEVIFEIPNNEIGDFFSVKLLNDDEYEENPYCLTKEINSAKKSKCTTKKILTPNNYQIYPATLYFKARILLYFDGLTLSILQSNKIIKSYEARSGKALNLQEREELEQRGYKHFVKNFECTNKFDDRGYLASKDSMQQSQQSLFYCYDKRYQDESKSIKDGKYFVSKQEIKDLIKTYKNNKSKDFEISNATCVNTTDSTKSSVTLLLNIYKDEECSEYYSAIGDDKTIYNNTNTHNVKSTNNNIVIDNIDFFSLLKYIGTRIVENIACIVELTSNTIKSVEIRGYNDKVFAELYKPFASGTYIVLEAIQSNTANTDKIYWKESLYARKSKTTNFEIIQHKQRDKIFIGNYTHFFYLSTPQEIDSLRQYGYMDFIYIIYASSTNYFHKNTPYIKFSLNFEVGEGNDNNVREYQTNNSSGKQQEVDNFYYNVESIQKQNNSKSESILKESLQNWNQKQHILNLNEAVQFLMANYEKLNELYQSNLTKYNNDKSKAVLDYFRIYPQVAGKIAYIYYRFDLGNDEFIKSVKNDNGEYIKDRERFIIISQYILLNDSIDKIKQLKIVDEYKKLLKYSDIQSAKDFIDRLTREVCKKLKLPLKNIKFNLNIGFGKYEKQIIYINEKTLNDLNGRIKTVFHEIRHFYIEQYYTPQYQANQSVFKKYIYYSLQFYVEVFLSNVFEKFNKHCNNDDNKMIDCQVDNDQELYMIQPNERDPRYTATTITNILSKGL